MATKNLSHSKGNSILMFSKFVLCAAVLMLISACGGQMMPPPTSPVMTGSGDCTANCPVITAASVFSNIAETWVFQNGYGDPTYIDVLPQPDGSTIWHYTKTFCRSYWTPGACRAELYFNLSLIDGKWYSTGGHVMLPEGAPWNPNPIDFVYTVESDPGQPRPYLILADSGTVDNTTLPDPSPGTRWTTKMYVQNGFLVSEQWEGACVHEKWWFQIGRGLVRVEPLDTGSCTPADLNLIMHRVN